MRIQPTGFAVFPDYDMRAQFESMRLLSGTNVPVPRMVWLEADDASKAKSARTAMIFSRLNTLLSIPMLLAMTNQH